MNRQFLARLLPLCFALSLQGYLTPAADDNPQPAPGPAQAPRNADATVAERLRASLLNDTRLQDIRILGAQRQDDGTVIMHGLLRSEWQRPLVETQGLVVLDREVKAAVLEGPFTKVTAAGMELMRGRQPTPVDLLFAFEKLLPTAEFNVVRVGRYDTTQRRVQLCGIVRSHDVRERAESVLLATGELDAVDIDSVLVLDQPEPDLSTALVLTEALCALKRGCGDLVVELATHMLQRGRNLPLVWYLRGAGHLLLGQRETAIADIRMAVALEGEGAYSQRSARLGAFQSFQGRWRSELEDLTAFGRTISLVPPRLVRYPCQPCNHTPASGTPGPGMNRGPAEMPRGSCCGS